LRIAVVDASPRINLTHLNLARDLALFFDRVYVPRAVQEEVNKKGRFRYRLNRLYRAGFFTKCKTADSYNVRLLQAELDKGESEALIQAQEKLALYFIGDDSLRYRGANGKNGSWHVTPFGTPQLGRASTGANGPRADITSGPRLSRFRRDCAEGD
jgi:predicted nucleic acid-binding protein